MTTGISLYPIPALKDNYIWALIDPLKRTTIVVDPGVAEPVILFLQKEQLTLSAILITHHHWDHTNGIAELKKKFHIPVYAPLKDKVNEATHTLNDHDKIRIESWEIEALSIPGHTKGHMAYLVAGTLFCGDTLFSAGCGRIFEGSPKEMYDSLQKLAHLGNKTQICCGHEYTLNNLRFAQLVEPDNHKIDERIAEVRVLREKGLPSLPSTLEKEKETNPFLRCHSKTIKKNVAEFAKTKLNQPVDVFTWLRKWKDQF